MNAISQYTPKLDVRMKSSQGELAKFGYRSKRKGRIFVRILIYFGNMEEPIIKIFIFQKKNPQNLVTYGIVFSKKSFVWISQWILVLLPSSKILPKKSMYYELACDVENCVHINLKHNKIITNVVGYEWPMKKWEPSSNVTRFVY